MLGHCKDCKFWGVYENEVCDRTDSCNDTKELTFSVFAYADDDSGLNAHLVNGPDFGCVKFEPMQQKEVPA